MFTQFSPSTRSTPASCELPSLWHCRMPVLLRYIEHGIIHIVRVAPSQKFKGLIHGHPIILESRKDP
jgi:hypothetical protein